MTHNGITKAIQLWYQYLWEYTHGISNFI